MKETYTVVVDVAPTVPAHAVEDRLKYALLWVDGIGDVTVTKVTQQSEVETDRNA